MDKNRAYDVRKGHCDQGFRELSIEDGKQRER